MVLPGFRTAPGLRCGGKRGLALEVFALVGPAGTGKSHRALLVAREHGIPAVIDDGLLIEGGKIRAGSSAKTGRTRLEAVRLAIFAYPEHAREVQDALARLAPPRVLVLGTSPAMVSRICGHLGLPGPVRVIDITEVATPEEIEAALRSREREGKHVVPAPTFEVKRRFRQHLVAPLRILYRGADPSERAVLEKSVVRPPYNNLGKLFIAEGAIQGIFERLLAEEPVVAGVLRSSVATREEGVALAADVCLRFLPGQLQRLREAQQRVARRLEDMTAVTVLALDLVGRTVVLEGRPGGGNRPPGTHARGA